jgi:uncharacterized protein (UPF0212 family)
MIGRNRLAQCISLQQQGAATLYSALPSENMLRLPSEHMRLALCRRLCVNTCTVPAGVNRCPSCGKDFAKANPTCDTSGDYHIEICHRDGFNARRHNDVQNTLQIVAARMGQPSTLATVVSDENDPDKICDLCFPHMPGRKGRAAVVIDLSICHHSAVSSRAEEAVPLAKSDERAKVKIAKYEKLCNDMNLDFMPVVFESTGALGQSAKDFFAVLSANSTTLPDESMSSSNFSKTMQYIAVSLARSDGNKFVVAAARYKGNNTRSFLVDGRRSRFRCAVAEPA